MLIFRLPGARVVLRPSGTEPKIKCYIEITEPLAGRSLGAAREAAAGRLAPLRSALEAMLADAPCTRVCSQRSVASHPAAVPCRQRY